MEWWVKKVQDNASASLCRVVLQSGALEMIAEIEACRLRLREGDKLTDAPRDKCTLSCAINGIHAAFHYLKKNYISGCVMTVPTGW